MALLHLVMWQLQGESTAARQRHAQDMADAFSALVGQVPGLLRLHVGPNAVPEGQTDETCDLGLAMVFESHEALQAYNTHPVHLAIKQRMTPLRRSRAVVDIEMENF